MKETKEQERGTVDYERAPSASVREQRRVDDPGATYDCGFLITPISYHSDSRSFHVLVVEGYIEKGLARDSLQYVKKKSLYHVPNNGIESLLYLHRRDALDWIAEQGEIIMESVVIEEVLT